MTEPIILKNNTITLDPRLDRVLEFDSRSKRFPIRALHEGKKRRSYTWSCDLRLNQGATGGCVGNGITHELAARPAPVRGLDEKFAIEKIYWPAQEIDQFPGGAYPGAYPYQQGTSVLAGIKAAHKLGYFKGYRVGLSLEDLVMGVGHNGPAVMGVNWYRGMMDTDSKKFVHVEGDKVGGHCLLTYKVNIKKEYFGWLNSWGPEWGEDGCCKISFDDMQKLIDQMGESWWFLHRHNKPR